MEAIMGFETRKLIFRVTMAAVVSVAAIFVIHVAAAYPQEAEIIAQDSASGGYENAVSNEAAQLRDHQQLRRYFLSGSSSQRR
jgi:hypothetical protein